MRISDVTLEKLLLRSGVATAEQIESLKQESVRSRRPLQEVVIQNELPTRRLLSKPSLTIHRYHT
jgi:hypothetical protein